MNAEAYFSSDGKELIFQTTREDLECDQIYRMNVDGTNQRMVSTGEGSNKREILSNGSANFSPYFHPDGTRIIFSSNMDDPGGRDFEIYMIGLDGTGLERITYNPSFDSFPMFSLDGTKLVFASNRDGSVEGETNVFVADWVETAPDHVENELGKPRPGQMHADATHLASDEMEGRGIGTKGHELATAWLVEEFKEIGLKPWLTSGYLDTFEVAVDGTLNRSTLRISDTAVPSTGFRPLAFSSSATVEAESVFVGYGIQSREFDYEDYSTRCGALDLTGKVAVMARFEPQRHDEESRFHGAAPIRESDLRHKVLEAKHRGAAAVIIFNPKPMGKETDVRIAFGTSPSDLGIPIIHLRNEDARRWGFL